MSSLDKSASDEPKVNVAKPSRNVEIKPSAVNATCTTVRNRKQVPCG